MAVHSLAHARAALRAAQALGQPVILVTPPDAARYAGPLFFKHVITLAEQQAGVTAAEAVIDCGEHAGIVMAALRCGWRHLAFSGPARARARLHSMAVKVGGQVVDKFPAALDLLDSVDPEGDCRAYLACR